MAYNIEVRDMRGGAHVILHIYKHISIFTCTYIYIHI